MYLMNRNNCTMPEGPSCLSTYAAEKPILQKKHHNLPKTPQAYKARKMYKLFVAAMATLFSCGCHDKWRMLFLKSM